MPNLKHFTLFLALTIFTKTLNCMEAPAQPQTNQPLAPPVITLISSEGNLYTLNGPKLLQAEYFKTLLRFEQAKSKAPETVTEISIKMPNTILEPITMLINIAHASSELTEEQTISKLIEAIGNITNIDERIISFLIQAHTFEQPLITRAIARSIAEVITEQDVVYFRQLAPNSEHQNLNPAYQVLIINEIQPTVENAHWLLHWLINLNEKGDLSLLELTTALSTLGEFIAHNAAVFQKNKAFESVLRLPHKVCTNISSKALYHIKSISDLLTSNILGKDSSPELFADNLTKVRQAAGEAASKYDKDKTTANKQALKAALDALLAAMAEAQSLSGNSIIKRAYDKADTELGVVIEFVLGGPSNIPAEAYEWVLANQTIYNNLFK